MHKALEGYKQSINIALEQFFTELPDTLALELPIHSRDALAKIEEYSLRSGKRIRGSLTCFAYDYASGKKSGISGIRAAVAMELVQNYLLIVDDVMDCSALRRGKPTVHEIYLAQQKQSPKDTHLANMLAINAGLIAQHLVNLALLAVDETPERVRQAILLLHKNITATGFGQIEDAAQTADGSFTEEDILRKYTLKSGYYTFVCPLQVGLVLGGKNEPHDLKEVTDFGLAAGIAFQLKDDLLGIFASSEATGKPNTDDIEEGKYTLLIHHALIHANGADKSVLKELLGKKNVSESGVRQVQNILEKAGSKAYVEAKIKEYADKAKAHIAASSLWDDNAKDSLANMVNYSVERTR